MPTCFARGCYAAGPNILNLGDIGASFWCDDHLPSDMIHGTGPKELALKKQRLSRIRGLQEADDDRQDPQ